MTDGLHLVIAIDIDESFEVRPGCVSNFRYTLTWKSKFEKEEFILNSVGPLSLEAAILMAKDLLQTCG